MTKPEEIFDGLLVLQYQNGNKKAFTLLVTRWHTKLCRQAFWYTKDRDVAKDIVQDSWGVILKKIYFLKNANSFGSWALTIVNRRAIDSLRASKKTTEKLHQIYHQSKNRDTSMEDSNSIENERTIDKNYYTKGIMDAINNLPKNQEIVIRMFYLDEYSILEISTILEISKGTVKSRLFYAREKLKQILKRIKNEK